ncbi:autotransporter outer membrane beta-barrel domain-containing protein [Helicobacter sp.]|uniref:autotransporter outer membrane beta-barrel domain-containing protein n=1 Tax=Helicobacter sp. TaxID=218 RepID=UPI002A750B8F|nr:autotransporter outer membrane beta-barrel domain-containing protein [Helicobacter sp.]MDY2584641.1 autotransporter outer membrane beta-barrel domain-containing protein [Helicobacter sp.]
MPKISNSISVALSRVLLSVGVASTICVAQTLADTQDSQQDASQQSASQMPDNQVSKSDASSNAASTTTSPSDGKQMSGGDENTISDDSSGKGGRNSESGGMDSDSSGSGDMSSDNSGGGTGETDTASGTDTGMNDDASDGKSDSSDSSDSDEKNYKNEDEENGEENGENEDGEKGDNDKQAQQPTATPETPAPATPTPPSIDTALENAKKELSPQLQSIFTLATQINDSNLDAQTKQALSNLKQDPKKLVDFIQSVEKVAKSQTNTVTRSSANTAMNVSNEVSITARNTQYSNPYAIAKLEGAKFAALDSDVNFDYYGINNSIHSVWANTFGGASIIDSNNGSLYGLSIGFDQKATDALLLGVYGTYSNSTIKDTDTKNKSNNFQLGLYTTYQFASNLEFNAKVYGQVSKTDFSSTLTTGIVNADYTQRFFGLSGNVGKILNPSAGFYFKPFVGLNYAYGYTPSYTEKGILAKQVHSISSNTLSLDLGAEFRNYINANSYFFITPKIEQYLTNNGDDYVANFIGANSTFSIKSANKKKTYAQVLVGGNMNLSNSVSVNVGFGIKHLLRGQMDSKDETYLSGNVGLKYKF